MHLKKSVMDYKVEHLKIVANGCQNTKTTEDKKFWINAHTLIEKQFNQDRNTSIHLKKNDQDIKVNFIFWFLLMIFYLCFYHRMWANWLCIYIVKSSGHFQQTNLRLPKCLWMLNTECNAHQIDILDNLPD